MRDTQRITTFRCCFEDSSRSSPRSNGMASRRISNKVTKEVVNSFEFNSLLTIFYASTVTSFYSIAFPLIDELDALMEVFSNLAFSKANAFKVNSNNE